MFISIANNRLQQLRDQKTLMLVLVSAIVVFELKHFHLLDSDRVEIVGLEFFWLTLVIVIAAINITNRAEYLAHKYGEPHGTLILTFAAVLVEMIMLSSIMLHEEHEPTLARDTVYSVIMIVINGLIGVSMFLGGLKHGEQKYNFKSSNTYFSMILAFVGVSLLLPKFIAAASMPVYELFLILVSIFVYIIFLRAQTKEHRHFFSCEVTGLESPQVQIYRRQDASGWYHGFWLLMILILIGYLADSLAVILDDSARKLSLPHEAIALYVALLILAPEGITSIRAGLNNEMQRVVNICLGSVLSTITLTVPAVLLVGMVFTKPMILGVTNSQAVMLFLTLFVGMNSYRHGETNAMQGVIHFTLFAAYIVFMFLPAL